MKTENLRKKQAAYKIRLLKWMQEIRQLCTDNASRSKEILEIRSIAEDFIEEVTDEKKAEIVKNGSDVNASVRLPRLELPKFHVDVLKFTAFWEQFEDCIHTRRDISDCEVLFTFES
ncbi:hypothetical protein T05_13581 [Trichinella murrelli]|uniref:Uncharacterized protein n=1 Tax=Trichinella murrelli TaxID=144512 RepID=A0A0V0TDT5_9BILA|nr:hypothetical protein T05_13581 [Trichinella murrelli]